MNESQVENIVSKLHEYDPQAKVWIDIDYYSGDGTKKYPDKFCAHIHIETNVSAWNDATETTL